MQPPAPLPMLYYMRRPQQRPDMCSARAAPWQTRHHRAQHILTQVDALVRAVRDAERELLASDFWVGLRGCFDTAQERLAGQLARPHAESGWSGAQQAEVAESPTAARSRGSVAQHATDQGAGPLAAEGRERHSTENVSPGRAPEVEHARSLPQDSLLASRQPHESLPECPAPESRPADNGLGKGKPVDISQSSAAWRATSAGPVSRSTAAGLSSAVLGRWADVRRLVVYGLGSLESGTVSALLCSRVANMLEAWLVRHVCHRHASPRFSER